MKKHFLFLIAIFSSSIAMVSATQPLPTESIELVEKIEQKYRVRPRMRFDVLLDGSCQQDYPCQDKNEGIPIESVCNMIRYGSRRSEELKSAKDSCQCQTNPNYLCSCNFPSDNCAERQLIELSTRASEFISKVAKQRGYSFDVTPLELYLIFLMEGSYFPVATNQTCEIDGFSFLGLDNLMTSSKTVNDKYIPWSHPDFLAFVKSKAKQQQFTNEQNQKVYSISNFDIESGFHAFAAMYGYYKSFADDRLLAVPKVSIASLPRRGQIFWAYLHFNSGETNDVTLDPELYDRPWVKNDNFGKNRMSTIYNSKVRTATYVYASERCRSGATISSRLCTRLE